MGRRALVCCGGWGELPRLILWGDSRRAAKQTNGPSGVESPSPWRLRHTMRLRDLAAPCALKAAREAWILSSQTGSSW